MPRPSSSGAQPQSSGHAAQTLTIEGQTIDAEFRFLPLATVELDLSNPRIQYLLKQNTKNGKLTQEELAQLIRDNVPGAPGLFASIRDNGGLLEPILVRPDGRVIEGNCRLACYMRLLAVDKKRAVSSSIWSEIPAFVVPNISERQVAAFQGRVHVAGKNPWRAYEKAGHIYTMHKKHGMDAKAIAQILSMTESEVLRDIRTYETMTEKLIPKMKGTAAVEKWSFFAEFYKRKGLEQYRSKPANVDEFVSLVRSGKLTRGADVRKLEKILKSKSAMKELKTKGVDSAMTTLGQADPTADSKTFRQLKKTVKLLQRFPAKDLSRLRESEPQRILQELLAAARTVAKTAGVKVP
jgi:hypothetical protein